MPTLPLASPRRSAIALVLAALCGALAPALPAGPALATEGDRWQVLITAADQACARADYSTAERRLFDALHALPVEDEAGRRARDTYHRLGLVYAGQGDVARAEEALLTALGEGALAAPLADEPSARLGYLHSLANLYESIGEWPSAEARRQQMIDVATQAGMTAGSLAVVNANMARFHVRHGDPERGLEWHGRALEILARDGGPSEIVAEQHEAIAVIHKDAGRLAESAAAYAEALALWDTLGQPATFVYARTLAGHAELLWLAGDRNAALDELDRAIGLAQSLLGRDTPALRDFFGTYVTFLTELGETTRAGPEDL
jgi:tetratricopeptide (TPR) repeat protein